MNWNKKTKNIIEVLFWMLEIWTLSRALAILVLVILLLLGSLSE